MNALEMITERIREYDDQIEKLGEEKYPEVALLKQVKGVGTLIALTYILTLEDPRRFRKSRDAACYVGLQPGRRSSGQSEPQLHITREEDSYLPMVLVQGAQHILGPLGEDSDLRRWGLKLAERGGKNAKSARSLQCHGSWRSCYTISGSAVRHTSRCTIHGSAEWPRHRSEGGLIHHRKTPGSGDCALALDHSGSMIEREVAQQMAAPAVSRTPMCTERMSRSRRVRMEGWTTAQPRLESGERRSRKGHACVFLRLDHPAMAGCGARQGSR